MNGPLHTAPFATVPAPEPDDPACCAPPEDKLALAVRAAQLGLYEWDLATGHLALSEPACRIVGLRRPPEGPILRVDDLFRQVHYDDVENVWAWDNAARRGEPFHGHYRILRPDGLERWLTNDATVQCAPNGAPVCVVGILADATELKAGELALRQARDRLEGEVLDRTEKLRSANDALANEVEQRRLAESQVRQLLGQLVTIEEEERRNVSRELHDTVGQHLTAITLGLKMIGDAEGVPTRMRATLERLRRSAQRLDDDIERLSHRLRPTALDDLGVDDALRQHVSEWREETGVDVTLHVRGLRGRRWPELLETTLFRLVQESLNNVRKHADAQRVTIIVERHRGELRLVVEDDGRGFDVDGPGRHTPDGGGLGLRGMRERAAMAGGKLDVESTPGQGTTMFVTLPIEVD